MSDVAIILGQSVKHVETLDENTTCFLVVSVKTKVGFTVVRRENVYDPVSLDTNTVWSCPCAPNGPPGCDHIKRAHLYYQNMMEKAEKMKKQAKAMARIMKEEPPPAISLLETKRRIKLEDE